jgi:hypothetical protein
MKKKLKLTSLNVKGVENLEVDKLQKIRGGGTCTSTGGSCTLKQSLHDKFAAAPASAE